MSLYKCGLPAQAHQPERLCPHALFAGELSIRKSLDREQQSSYQLQVLVQDGGTPPRSTTGTIYVTVLDENDNAPTFLHVAEGREFLLQVRGLGGSFLSRGSGSLGDREGAPWQSGWLPGKAIVASLEALKSRWASLHADTPRL